MNNLYLTDGAYVPTTYKCVQIGLYIKDISLYKTLMLVPKCPLNRGSTVSLILLAIKCLSLDLYIVLKFMCCLSHSCPLSCRELLFVSDYQINADFEIQSTSLITPLLTTPSKGVNNIRLHSRTVNADLTYS